MAGKLFLVACLCAEWCTSCRSYRAVFEAAAAAYPDVAFRWVDIEDEAALFDDIDVENFPTLLIGDDQPRFYGTVLPQPEVLARLVAAHRDGAAPAAVGSEIVTLLSRLRER